MSKYDELKKIVQSKIDAYNHAKNALDYFVKKFNNPNITSVYGNIPSSDNKQNNIINFYNEHIKELNSLINSNQKQSDSYYNEQIERIQNSYPSEKEIKNRCFEQIKCLYHLGNIRSAKNIDPSNRYISSASELENNILSRLNVHLGDLNSPFKALNKHDEQLYKKFMEEVNVEQKYSLYTKHRETLSQQVELWQNLYNNAIIDIKNLYTNFNSNGANAAINFYNSLSDNLRKIAAPQTRSMDDYLISNYTKINKTPLGKKITYINDPHLHMKLRILECEKLFNNQYYNQSPEHFETNAKTSSVIVDYLHKLNAANYISGAPDQASIAHKYATILTNKLDNFINYNKKLSFSDEERNILDSFLSQNVLGLEDKLKKERELSKFETNEQGVLLKDDEADKSINITELINLTNNYSDSINEIKKDFDSVAINHIVRHYEDILKPVLEFKNNEDALQKLNNNIDKISLADAADILKKFSAWSGVQQKLKGISSKFNVEDIAYNLNKHIELATKYEEVTEKLSQLKTDNINDYKLILAGENAKSSILTYLSRQLYYNREQLYPNRRRIASTKLLREEAIPSTLEDKYNSFMENAKNALNKQTPNREINTNNNSLPSPQLTNNIYSNSSDSFHVPPNHFNKGGSVSRRSTLSNGSL